MIPAKCLVVSDSPTVRRVLRNALHSAGAEEILEASSANEALQLSESGVGLVVTDGDLPDLSGLELLKRLRVAVATAAVRCVLITSRNHRQDVIAAAEAGADLYILKPFVLEKLVERLVPLLAHEPPSDSRDDAQAA